MGKTCNEQNTRFLPDFHPRFKSSENRYFGAFENKNVIFIPDYCIKLKSRLIYKLLSKIRLDNPAS